MTLMTEDVMVLIAKERMDEAARCADLQRALRRARAPRRTLRTLLGGLLVRLGRRLLAEPVAGARPPIEPGRAQC